MPLTIKPSYRWMLKFAVKVFSWIVFLNLVVLPILWALNFPHLFALIFMYESTLILMLGVFQILGSFIYRKDSIAYRLGFRTGWFDFQKFSKLKPRERQRYRQEGIIMAIIGLALFLGTLIYHLYILLYP